MDDIAQQVNREIQALNEHIGRTEEHVLVDHWSQALLGPLEEIDHEMADADLIESLAALVAARDRLKLEGPFSDRLDTILQRHPDLMGQVIVRQAQISPPQEPLFPTDFNPKGIGKEDADLSSVEAQAEKAHSLFEEEDEEDAPENASLEDDEEPETIWQDNADDTNDSDDGHQSQFAPISFSPADYDPLLDPEELLDQEAQLDQEAIEPTENNSSTQHNSPSADDSSDDIDQIEFIDESDLFRPVTFGPNAAQEDGIEKDSGDDSEPSVPTTANSPLPFAALPFESPTGPDELFNSPTNDVSPLAPAASEENDHLEARSRRRGKTTKPPSRKRENTAPISVNPLQDKISLEDLQQKMGFSLTRQDINRLQLSLHEQINGRKLNALKTDPQAENRYLLIPRVSRFFYQGKLVDCTVKNLAKAYFGHFGDIKDLTQYKGTTFINHETPQTTWALIPPEALSDSLDKNYMEQQQFLRQLSGRVSLPSHLVRRRSLVEAIYDLLVGKLVLNRPLLQQTLDWTSDGPTKNDYICLYSAEEGIRLRDLTRTSHHRFLGLCPNW
jgi:hypothetical protein